MAAPASSSPARLLLRVLLPLVVAALVAGGDGGRPVVAALKELDGFGTARKNTDSKRAEMLGEQKKRAKPPRTSTTVLELKHHSLSTVPDDPAARDRYLRRLLAADEARANSLQPRSNSRASTTQSSQGAAEVPLTSGIKFQTLNYVTTIQLGGGAANLTVIVDTGSDLTWVQCKPCSSSSCYAQRDPLFDPAGSATYAAVPCNASACAASLKAATGAPGSCATTGGGGSGGASEKCYYAVAYGDGSFSRGVLATDTVGLGGAAAAASLEGFVFGCGLSNRGLFGGAAGLMGLGRTALSLVSQTAARYGGVFSYCLPATTAATGSLSLGEPSYRNTTPVAYTRMIADPSQPPFYFLNVTGAAVGGEGGPLAASGFGAANVLIDSGTVITRLAPSVYRAVRDEFARQFKQYPSAPGFSILDTCYDLSGHDEVKVPLLTLRLEGGADVTVDAAGMLFVVKKDGSQVCLAMASLSYEDQTPIIGNYQQKNKRVVYDTVASRIGFADEECSFV
ncbi:hypothetical protein EJB05_08660 [Eragrostis curvula]|uniref:Peptidase A1 domain-containing protein n=1 Tax=Eragrostis curvula TaxID=38414 RepID=A0A5J9W2Y9_9POAL|nr:hypothetical protein EJB05_08660 [Eragrostis curvula]